MFPLHLPEVTLAGHGQVFGQAEVCPGLRNFVGRKRCRDSSHGNLGAFRQEVLGEHFGFFFQGLDLFLSEVMKSEITQPEIGEIMG